MKFLFALFIAFSLFVCSSAARATYDEAYVGEQIKYKAVYEDTFVHLARDYNLGFVEMRAANPNIDPWIPGAGTKLILPTRHLLPEAPHEGIVINLPEMRLYAFVNGDDAPTTFPLGIGREGLATPTGTTKIVRKKTGPTWRPTGRMLEEDPELKPAYPPGPENPLGTHALYLGWPQYAIHGTNRPFGIGRRVSSGCIRLYPESIRMLFDVAPVGMQVSVVDQAIKVGWIDDRLYIEAHQNIEQTIDMEESGAIRALRLNDSDMARIMRIAGEHKDKLRWNVVRSAVKQRRGYPIEIARRLDTTDGEKNVLEEIYDSGEEEKTAYRSRKTYGTLNQ